VPFATSVVKVPEPKSTTTTTKMILYKKDALTPSDEVALVSTHSSPTLSPHHSSAQHSAVVYI
jgi:hypothetical protein